MDYTKWILWTDVHLMVLCRRGYYLEILECNLVKMGGGGGNGWNWLLWSLEWFCLIFRNIYYLLVSFVLLNRRLKKYIAL